MDGLPAETVDVLDDLIAQSEAHRDEHIATLHTLVSRGESSTAIREILGQIEDTRAAMRSRRAYLHALQPRTG
jgi:hypothetical protein